MSAQPPQPTHSSVLLPPGGQRILVIMAHPDDAEFICGGSIARLSAEGREIHYLLVTSGDKGSNVAGMTPERLATMREEEQQHATAVLGVGDVTFLRHQEKCYCQPLQSQTCRGWQ